MAVCKKFLALLLLWKRTHALLSIPPARTGSLHRPSTTASPSFRRCNILPSHCKLKHEYHQGPRQRDGRCTELVIRSASATADRDEGGEPYSSETTPLSVAMGVGVVTSLIGYLYSKCMAGGFRLLWRTIPSALLGGGGPSNKLFELLHRHPAAYIVLVMTLGGGLVATLTTLYFPRLFTAHDYVHVLSDTSGDGRMDQFPRARSTVLPLLAVSLLTSISGFSLGPEAPMVTTGGLIGVSLARKYLRSTSKDGGDETSSESLEETLAYAGAAGTLTGFMNIPLAGPIFALEMTSRGTGVSKSAAKSWNAAMAACFAGMVFIRGGLVPGLGLGGHFTYGAKAAVGAVTGREMALASLTCGVGGAIVGTMFHKTLSFLQSVIWPSRSSPSDSGGKSAAIGKKILVALAIGALSVLYPQTMFWGEGSLQCAVDGQCTPFSGTPHAIPSVMTALARVNPNLPYASGTAALQVGAAKFAAISLAAAGGFPGGVIFPLLSNGAALSHALISAARPLMPAASSSLVPSLMVMSFMAATLTSITRTPLATVLILALSASGSTPLSVLLPGAALASYISVWVSDRLSRESFFSYSE
mmetsp:Transcript_36103/g.76994  ORF Transcript_36103/g.76994 Transcript_36103/m.76994 type:complete len:587 (-) Transcript_36103:29-1789(-)|eukprot:CAMPEP_0172554822 /NCGR_PEP_ID=MMETSP1067-20121228/56599_1 /TAXON_ID=265564 ORGANISM="Thalassiosira punctigera, Strain Tpunct2005C2" /NCGR_SAMPLE_ID=MMETSP1067 /ASSEMBLY_ACC=CAM_ASM_000444 /LENGTH=586 /DNA_ID=CAMNT_0013343265 /DNA_START=76 /DNA_END=1836 /DNA_ORIENTATION=+